MAPTWQTGNLMCHGPLREQTVFSCVFSVLSSFQHSIVTVSVNTTEAETVYSSMMNDISLSAAFSRLYTDTKPVSPQFFLSLLLFLAPNLAPTSFLTPVTSSFQGESGRAEGGKWETEKQGYSRVRDGVRVHGWNLNEHDTGSDVSHNDYKCARSLLSNFFHFLNSASSVDLFTSPIPFTDVQSMGCSVGSTRSVKRDDVNMTPMHVWAAGQSVLL